jgi:hypothetical protein
MYRRDHVERLSINVRIILKWILQIFIKGIFNRYISQYENK